MVESLWDLYKLVNLGKSIYRRYRELFRHHSTRSGWKDLHGMDIPILPTLLDVKKGFDSRRTSRDRQPAMVPVCRILYQHLAKCPRDDVMRKRVLLLPVIWGAYGIGLVVVLDYLLGPILNSIGTIFHFAQNDKPIGGSYLPALFFNVTAMLAMIGFSLWALGIWEVDLASPKLRRDLLALGVMLGSGFLVFYSAIFLFPLIASLVYFLATNIE